MIEMIDLEDLPLQLLRCWRDRNIEQFTKLLKEGTDVNFQYKDEKFQPILGVISRDFNGDGKPFAAALLACTNLDRDKQYMSGKCAIHHAAEIGNLPVLEALVEARADINVLDQNGSTALHVLVQQKWKGEVSYKKCLELLLSQNEVQVNVVNRKGFTAMHLAVSKNNKEAVITLLEKGSLLDIDNTSVMGVTTREALLKQFPDLEPELPKNLGPEWSFVKMDGSHLFMLLAHREEARFCTAFDKEIQDKSQRHLLTYDNGKYTFLQYASRENMTTATAHLLSWGADPNYTPPHNNETPMDVAVRKGYPEILKLLLDASSGAPEESPSGATPLHTVTKYCHESPTHFACLNLLLTKKWDNGTTIDVNAKDCQGNTALHFAVAYSDNNTILSILQHGGYIGAVNKQGQTPLPEIPPQVLQNYLDSKVTHIGSKQDSKERFTFDYRFLSPPNCEKCPPEMVPLYEEKGHGPPAKLLAETRPLLIMSQSQDLRPILTHPVLTSFTYLKWQRIQAFFFVNLFFYLALCILLSGYILFGYRISTHVDTPSENSIVEVSHKIGQHDKTNFTKPETLEPNPAVVGSFFTIAIRLVILIFLILLFVRESFQFAINPKSYFKNFENYIELLLIFIAIYVIANDCSQSFNQHNKLSLLCPQFSAIVILLSWIQLVLLIGKHPKFFIQVEMFRTVSVSFIRFLTWYILIIIAFALSFYVLFRGCSGECGDKNPFTNPATSLFKTLVMLTGEFEAGDIPFLAYVGTSHIIFTAFVFLIAIVLLNLLNGLAVADTKEIRDDVYLYSCVARVKLISMIEEMFLGDTTSFLRPIYTLFRSEAKFKFILLEYFAKQIVFFPNLLPNGQIHVNSKKEGYSIEFVDGTPVQQNCMSSYNMDEATVRASRRIIEIRNVSKPLRDELGPKINACSDKIQLLADKLLAFERKFEAIEQSNKQIEKLLIQQMAIVSLNHANDE